MKLERLPESVLPTVVLVSGLCLAIFAGSLAGAGRTGTVVAVIGGIAAMAFFLAIRQRAWMLIPTFWMLSGKISVLPLPFSVRQLGVLFALGTFLLLKAFKIIRLKPKMGLLDIWVGIVLVYLLTVFLRNPVGVEALGAAKVGGKPYFDVFIGFASYWVLSRAVATPREAFFLPLLMVGVAFGEFVLNFIARRFPFTAGPLTKLYSGISALETGEVQVAAAGEPMSRQAYMMSMGTYASLAAFSFWRPFTVINPLYLPRFLIFLCAAYAILLSGFRSAFAGMMAAFLIGSYFRRGTVEVVRAGMLGLPLLVLVILLQGTLFDLPMPAQRALSFLPGKWDYAAREQASGSTEWRVVMWKAMLTGNKYIENKWLGDGFGFTRHQLDVMNANLLTGDNATQQENLLISGGVHSGPVSAIRFVGYVGLGLFLIFAVLVARRAAQLIRRCEKTPFYFLAFFIGIPAVWFPVNFVFIFGSYGDDLSGLLMTVGMLKLLENSLDAHEANPRQAPVPIAAKPRIQPRRPQYAPAGRLG